MINNKFPSPFPDRRITNNSSGQPFASQGGNNNPFRHFDSSNKDSFSQSKDKDEFDKLNNLAVVKLKHVEDMRKTILNFKLLND